MQKMFAFHPKIAKNYCRNFLEGQSWKVEVGLLDLTSLCHKMIIIINLFFLLVYKKKSFEIEGGCK